MSNLIIQIILIVIASSSSGYKYIVAGREPRRSKPYLNGRNLGFNRNLKISDFNEICTFRLGYVSSLVSVNDQKILETSMIEFIEENDSKFTNVDVKVVRQMLERRRNGHHFVLLFLIFSGSLNDYNSEAINVTKKIQNLFDNNISFIEKLFLKADGESYFLNVNEIHFVEAPFQLASSPENPYSERIFSGQPVISQFAESESVLSETVKSQFPTTENVVSSAETTDTLDNEESFSKGDIALAVGVCILNIGLIALISTAIIYLRGNRNHDDGCCKNDDDNSKMSQSTVESSEMTRSKGLEKNKNVFRLDESHRKNNNKSNGEINIQTTQTNSNDYSNEENSFYGEYYAPPGKLGVAVDTYNGFPVVHKVKPGSPLDGVLNHMDRIISIDETDVSSMTASEVTRIMVLRMTQPRKIRYVRTGKSGIKCEGNNIPEIASI